MPEMLPESILPVGLGKLVTGSVNVFLNVVPVKRLLDQTQE